MAEGDRKEPDIPPDEQALVRRAQIRLPNGQGTPDALAAFRELFMRISGALLGALIAFGMTAQRAEEFAQGALADAWRDLPNFKGGSSFLTWVTRIAHNDFLTEVASRKGKQARSERIELDPRKASPGESPDDAILRQERLALIHSLAENLPDNQRQAFVYRRIEGLSYEEIAEVMELSKAEVIDLAERAMDALEYATRDERKKEEEG